MRTRLLIGLLGVVMGSFGALRFLQLDSEDIVDGMLWLAGGVLVHDAFIAPLTLLVTLALGAWCRPRLARASSSARSSSSRSPRPPSRCSAGGGARADNPTLLDRNYVVGWLVFAALVLLGTLLVGPLGRLRRNRQGRLSQSLG